MGPKTTYRPIRIFTVLLLSLTVTNGLIAQTGPAGVGNSDGTNNQPKNILWVDASTLGLSNGANVSSWTDLSGNTNNATQATTDNMPIFKTDMINGLPVVRFRPTTVPDGINRTKTYLNFNGDALALSPYSIFSVAAKRTNGNDNYLLRGTNQNTNKMLIFGWKSSNNLFLSSFGDDLESSANNTTSDFYLIDGIQRSTNVNPSWGRALFQNGSIVKTGTSTNLLQSYDGAAIGRHYDVGQNRYASIDVAELIIYSSALNEAQRIIVDNYLSAKYATTMTENDHYASTTYTTNVVGIGTTDGTIKHSQTSGNGGGIYLREAGSSLDENNEFVFAGHNGGAISAITENLPTMEGGNIVRRSSRDWYIDRTESKTTSVNLGFKLTEIGLPINSANTVYVLLYRASTSDPFSAISTALGTVTDNIAWITVNSANLNDGYYTIAETNIESRIWYSYNTGNWDDWRTWTLEESGGEIINPNQLTPSTSPTANIDRVVIVSPYTVTVSTNAKSNAVLDMKSGTLDVGTTIGHQFNAILGQGKIELTEDNFPSGDASDFCAAGGGTVEYYGTGITLSTPRTFNNVEISLTNSTDVITLMANYTLNGYFTINKGIFQINDGTSTSILDMSIAGDVTINTAGKITVGEGNTIGSYSISDINTLPPLGSYHKIYHQLSIGGDLLNNGSIRLTNQAAPEYQTLTTTGAATLTFTGTTDKTATLNGTTDLYNLIIDKGIDKTFKLTIDPSNANYFRLFGANATGRRTGGIYTDANPEICKALWIKNGTLELTGKTIIPTLTEGRISSTDKNGDFTIPANACLWINGNDVEVYSTARTNPESSQLMPGYSGVDSTLSHQSTSIFGEFKITKGYFNTRNSDGMIFFPEHAAIVTIEGGLCDIAQFRSSTSNEAVGATAFVMSGGELFVRGATTFTWDTDYKSGYTVNPDYKSGDVNNNTYTYPSFGILNPNGVFQMTGGTIYIADVSSTFGGNGSTFNNYKSNALCINTKTENHNVTGGTIHVLLNRSKFDLSSTNPLNNLTITRRTGTTGEAHMASDLVLNGNLTLNDYAILSAQKNRTGPAAHNLPAYDLTVAGSFIMSSNSRYYPFDNTTTLYVTGSNSLVMNGTSAYQKFFNLVIKKNPNASATRLTLGGNSSNVTIHNDLTIGSGATLRHANKNIIVKGNIYNSGTIELADASSNTGKVQITDRGIVTGATITAGGSYSSIPSITISAPASGETATAVAIFSDIPGTNNKLPLIGIAITNSGSGYTTAPTITIGESGGGAATAVISTQHEIGGDGNGTFANLEVDEVHPSETGSKQEVTYLTAKQTVSNVFTLTNGILDIGTYNFDVYKLSTYGTNNEENSYSATKLIRTASNYSDGGLTLSIFENGTYFFPLGTYNTTSKANRYAWAKPVISNFSDVGKLQINGVNEKLATMNWGGITEPRYLQYYWRVRYSGLTNDTKIKHQFIGYKADRLPTTIATWFGITPGKVVNNVRSTSGSMENSNFLGNNGTSNLLNFDESSIETGEFTCGSVVLFWGQIYIYYTRVLGNGYGLKWNIASNWTRSDLLNDNYSPHDSRQTSAPAYPGPGDIAVIGWVPWDQASNTGKPHGICIDKITIEVAKVEFSQMTDADGNPVPRNYYSNFQFRPCLCINESGELDAGIVEGEGMFWNRWSDPDFSTCDIGDFVACDSSFIVYENKTNNRTYNNIPATVPNIVFSSDGWGENDNNIILATNLKANGNVQILGNTNLLLSGGTAGDIETSKNLLLYSSMGNIGSNAYSGGILRYPNSANARTVTVHGDIIINNAQGIIDITGSTYPTTDHRLNLYGSIYQKTTSGGGLQLNVNNGNHVSLYLLGEGIERDTIVSGAIPNFYRIIMDKGSSQSSQFTFHNDFNLLGPTDGDSKTTKALELNNGMFVLNNKDIDITLSSGGADFEIPSTTGLQINQGTARITATGDNGINLDGHLGIAAVGANQGQLILDGGAGSNNYIQYSSSGNAVIKVETGKLYVGSQIRSTTENNLGVLRYMQIGKTGSSVKSEVTVGARCAPVNTRGIFEVFNPGSIFYLLNGTLTVANAHDTQDSETRAAFYLDPNSKSVNAATTINIGAGTNGGTITMNSAVDLGIVNVTGNATAKLHVRSLGVLGDLTIYDGSTFNGNSLNLTLSSDIINRGTKNLQVDSLYFIGDEQEIDGDIETDKMFVQPTSSVTLTGETDTVTINTLLNITSGTLANNTHVIEIKGDMENGSIHSTTGVGHLLFNNTAKQNIEGSGDFGAIKLDNAEGLELQSNISMNNDLTMTNGCLLLKDNRLTLSQNSSIIGSNFSGDKMIRSNGNIGDAGICKNFAAGALSFTFPIGVKYESTSKYTPVEFAVTASANAGSIALHPVNQQHMTTLSLGSDMLQYYWVVESNGLSGFTGAAKFHYLNNDVQTADKESEYLAARLVDDAWAKYPHIGSIYEDDDYMLMTYGGVSSITGDYTAGCDENIPATVPIFISNGNGVWTDVTKWTSVNGFEVPEGGPQGHIVRIREQDTIRIDRYRVLCYKTQIYGRLETDTIGHNFGRVSGTGTIVYYNDKIFPGEYTEFIACGTGGTVEFSGGTYTLPTFNQYTTSDDQYNNLVISGTGIKSFPDRDVITICGDLSIIGNTTLKMEHWGRANNKYKLTYIKGNAFIESNATWDMDYGEDIRAYGDLTLESGGSFKTSYFQHYYRTWGSSPISIKGNYTGNNSFNMLHFKNSSIEACDGPVNVKTILYPNLGTITTSSTNLLCASNSNGDGLIYPASYTGIVEGPIKINMRSATTYKFFPVGKNSVKKFINLTSLPSAVSYYTGEYFGETTLSGGMDPELMVAPLQTVSKVEYWSINSEAGSSIGFNLPITSSNDICQTITSLSNLRIAMWNGTAWEKVASAPSTGATRTSGTVGTTSNITLTAGQTYYFTLAAEEEILIPTVQFTTPDTTICQGESVNLAMTFTGSKTSTTWSITYSDGSNSHTVNDLNNTNNTITVTPSATTTYTITSVSDDKYIGNPSGTVIGNPVKVTVIATPTEYTVSASANTICGIQTISINLSGSQRYYTYELYRNGSFTGTSLAGTNSAISFTGITLEGTYTIYAYRTGYSLCKTLMSGSSIITVSSGATAIITGFATNDSICSGNAVQITVSLTGVAPFNLSILETGGNPERTFSNITPTSDGTFTYTVSAPPAWYNQNVLEHPQYIAKYVYTITNVSDNSGCGGGSATGEAVLSVFKIPETGEQYHIPNNAQQ